jgi:hypothetical protein
MVTPPELPDHAMKTAAIAIKDNAFMVRLAQAKVISQRGVYSNCNTGKTNAAINPMLHIAAENQINRRFHLSALSQAAASSGSKGHVRPGRYTDQAERAISPPERPNIHPLYMLSETSHGAVEAIDATAVPMPRLTSIIGMAQQISVPDVVNSSSQLQALGFDAVSIITS